MGSNILEGHRLKYEVAFFAALDVNAQEELNGVMFPKVCTIFP